MGQFATGITVVSTKLSEQAFGFTANSFASVSMEPPMVLCCIKNESSFLRPLKQTKKFSVSILSIDQQDVSNLFANPNIDSQERFKPSNTDITPLGNPIIKDCLTWMDCDLVDLYPAGDHQICVGLVRGMKPEVVQKNPILYYDGSYRSLEQQPK